MNFPKRRRVVSHLLLLLSLLLWQGTACPPGPTLVSKDLPLHFFWPRNNGFLGANGTFCFSIPYIAPEAFSPGPGEFPVGFDDYWDSGTFCDAFRNNSYSAHIGFDLSQFDALAGAELLFEASASYNRSHGETIGSVPPKSYATTLGVARATTFTWPDDNESSLPAGPLFNVGVTSQVKDWIGNPPAHQNFGFVIWGPRGEPDSNNIWKDSDAQVTMYKNFRLRVLYDPKLNPRVK
jgi:hypothetical protein